MIKFLKRLFGFGKKKEILRQPAPVKQTSAHVVDHDMIDYDGMGNQGRFPMH